MARMARLNNNVTSILTRPRIRRRRQAAEQTMPATTRTGYFNNAASSTTAKERYSAVFKQIQAKASAAKTGLRTGAIKKPKRTPYGK